MPLRLSYLLAALLLTNAMMESAHAQSILDRAKRATKDAVGREVEGVADRAATSAIGATEDAIVCAVTDERCIRRARRDNQELVIVDKDGKPMSHENAPAGAGTATGSASATATAPGQGVWANYDFVPGSRVLFYEDYANDRVGNFPRRLEFRSGNMEIVEWEGGRALRVNSRGAFDIRLPEQLPDGFTIEFDAYVSEFVNDFKVYPVDAEGKATGPHHVQVDPYGGVGIASFNARASNALSALQSDRERLEHRMTPVRVMADGAYIKVFLEETRVANVPVANLGRSTTLRFDFNDVRSQPIYIGPIHVAASDRSLYDSLRADGRVATQGILFATGSATIRPESTPTLDDIAEALRGDSSLRLRVEGHTDNVGDPAANQRLSEQRAQAVVEFLVRSRGVAENRLEAAGIGQAQPAADNGTPEGRQTNRRVELVVL